MGRPLVPRTGWVRKSGPEHPYVLSTRARLARNIEGFIFPPAARKEELERVRDVLLETAASRLPAEEDWDVKYVEEIPRLELALMAEERLVVPGFGQEGRGQGVVLRWKEGESVMVNEEDHLRINVILPGVEFMKAWKIADKLDSRVEEEIQYCYDDRWGYLTSCPTNAGTGLRVSAVVHVPGLVMSGEWNMVVMGLGRVGIDLRGIFGEGSPFAGNLVQVSNYSTLGIDEEEILREVERATRQVVEREKTARKVIAKESETELSDSVNRALGILERAQRLYYYEALGMLSLVKLGVELEMLPVKEFSLMDVSVSIAPAHLRYQLGSGVEEGDVDKHRPRMVRRLLGL